MPRDVDIQPGQTFHLPAAQEKNIGDLMKILGKKEATEALTAIGKTTPEAWEDIKETVGELKDIVVLGGSSEILQSFKDHVESTLDLAIEGALSPITNTLDTLIGNQLEPIMRVINTVANELSEWFAENNTGSFIGALIGSLYGEAGKIIGAIIGAAIEELIQGLGDLPEIFGVGRQSQEEFMAQQFLQLFLRGQITWEEYLEKLVALGLIII